MTAPSEKDLFIEALELAPAQRSGFLSRACGGNELLREQVEELLRVSDESSQILKPSPLEQPGDLIRLYRLQQVLGEGGCGIVYEAEQSEPIRRRVALKVIRAGMDTRSVIARFEAERQALALMDHPGIAKVLDAGATDAGRPYFVMELVHGEPITKYCERLALSLEARLRLFIQVCHAIQHAHQKGIIHRDLKPSNILVADQDGAPVPKIIDFGVAKAIQGRLTANTVVTELTQLIGTPAYMSPEQALLTSEDIDTRSDIYSLGILLYELLAGTPPFTNQELLTAGLDEMRRMIREVEPPRPSLRLQQIAAASRPAAASPSLITRHSPLPTDLDWIVMKCLEKDRARRYDTASALGADLTRFLQHEPILARPITPAQRAWRWCRRQPALAAACSIALLLLLLVLVGSPIALYRINQARQAEAAARTRAEANTLAARRAQYASDMNLAHQAVLEGDIFRARQLLEQHAPAAASPPVAAASAPSPAPASDLRGWEWSYLETQTRRDDLGLLGTHSNLVFGLAISPDGRHAASACFDGHLSIWDVRTRALHRQLPRENDSLYAVEFSPDGRTLASAGDTGLIRLRHTDTWADLPSLATDLRVMSLAFSGDGRWLAAAGLQGLEVWNVQSGQRAASIPAPLSTSRDFIHPRGLAFSPDSGLLASSHDRQSVRIYASGSWQELKQLSEPKPSARPLAFSPDGQWLATGGSDVRIWRVADWTRMATLTNYTTGSMAALAFSPGGESLASSGSDQRLRLWRTSDWVEYAVLKGDLVWANRLQYTPDGRALVTASDRSLQIWPTEMPRPLPSKAALPEDSLRLWRLTQVSPDGRTLAIALTNATVAFWDMDDLQPVTHLRLLPQEDFVRSLNSDALAGFGKAKDPAAPHLFASLAVDSGRQLAAFGSINGVLVLRSLARGQIERIGRGHTEFIDRVCFSPDGTRVASTSQDRTLRIWDTATGAELDRHPISDSVTMALQFSENGAWLGQGDWSGEVRVWRLGTTNTPQLLIGHRRPVRWLCFTPDHQRVVTSSYDDTVRVWHLATGRMERELPIRGSTALSISPDGQRLALAGYQHVRLYETVHWQPVAAFPTPEEESYITGFSDNGRTLFRVGDRSVQLWRAPALDLPTRHLK